MSLSAVVPLWLRRQRHDSVQSGLVDPAQGHGQAFGFVEAGGFNPPGEVVKVSFIVFYSNIFMRSNFLGQ